MINEIADFIYNSNLIEGINLPVNDETINDSSIPEVYNHFMAFQFMFFNHRTSLTIYKILQIHKILMKNLVDSRNCGNYRICDVIIDGNYGANVLSIPYKMKDLILMDDSKDKTIEECWDIHNEFEIIHPFVDGNGRVGRLILNWMLLKNRHELKIIKFNERDTYYERIRKYRNKKEGKI